MDTETRAECPRRGVRWLESEEPSRPSSRRDAVALVVTREGKTVSEVARNLGIARSLLQRWIEQHRAIKMRDGSPRKVQKSRDGGAPPAAASSSVTSRKSGTS